MGHITYGSESFEFADVMLGHLQMVVSTKLRRGEHFFLTWPLPAYMGSGRHSIWIDNAVPLLFSYTTEPSKLDMAWMEWALAEAAKPKGLHLSINDPFSTTVPKPPDE
jgi:hypothetical protein